MARLSMLSRRSLVAAALCLCYLLAVPSFAKDDYRIAWSIYVGGMPSDYAARSGWQAPR